MEESKKQVSHVMPLWKGISLVETFISENPCELSEQELGIIEGWSSTPSEIMSGSTPSFMPPLLMACSGQTAPSNVFPKENSKSWGVLLDICLKSRALRRCAAGGVGLQSLFFWILLTETSLWSQQFNGSLLLSITRSCCFKRKHSSFWVMKVPGVLITSCKIVLRHSIVKSQNGIAETEILLMIRNIMEF